MTPTAISQAGLFTRLAPLLAHRAVLITVSRLEDDQIQVNICPRQLKDGENQALTIPLCVTGTPAELDLDFVPQISSFVASQAGLNSNLAAIEQEIAQAEKAAREEAKKKNKVVGNGGKKTDDSSSSTGAPKPEPAPMLSLFDQQTPTGTAEATQQTVTEAG